MLSKETLKLACDLMINLAKQEKKVEINRQVLGQNLDFDAYQVFAYLDIESKNYINEVNIMNFLQKRNGIPCTVEELQFLIFFYDENFDGKISYTEFLNLILSDNNYALRKSTRERVGSCYGKSILPFNVEYSMVKLLQRELELIRTTWTIIAELKTRNDFNIHDLFHYMKGYGCITAQSMKLFLQRNFIEFDEEDIRTIIKRLDINKDSKVNFCEFHAFFCFPNLNCTCCSSCNCNCQNTNNNNMSIYNSNNSNNNSYISQINAQLKQAINNNNNSYNNINNGFNTKLNMRQSPERTTKANKVQRAKSSNNLKINNTSNNKNNNNNNNSDMKSPSLYSEQDTAYLSPSLQLVPSAKKLFSSNNKNKTNQITNEKTNNNNNNNKINNPNNNKNNNKNKNNTQYQFYNNNKNNISDKNSSNNLNKNIYKNNTYTDKFYINNNKNNSNCICSSEKRKNCKYCNNYPCYCNEIEFKAAEQNFLKFLCQLIEIESKIEEAKINLLMRSDFNVEDAFRIFENPENETISFQDLQKGLKQLGIFASLKELKLLMRRADIKNRGYINYGDFFDLLVPFQKIYRDNAERRIPSSFMPSYNKSEIFLYSTKIYLTNLFRLIISCEDQLNIFRENLIGVKTQLEKIFNKIDNSGLDYITDMELYMYLKNNGIDCNEIDNSLIFIRFDKNRNGKVEIWEIEEELTPS